MDRRREIAREGPRASPAHALTDVARTAVLALANSPTSRDGSPHQIVPRLADTGVCLASASTIYRLLRDTHAATLCTTVCHEHIITPAGLVLRADTGGPMNGATMVSTVERLGVIPSFSRPRVSDDHPYSEALFRTLTYCPAFPALPFHDVEAARAWVIAFVAWYRHHHQHSAIQCVTPDDRHTGLDVAILAPRDAVYHAARVLQPERWSGATRDWTRPTTVYLNAARADLATPAGAAGEKRIRQRC